MTDPAPQPSVTRLLEELRSPGVDPKILRDRLYEVLYGELHRVAAGVMRAERPDHTLQPTALVHEAFLRLVELDSVRWENGPTSWDTPPG